MLHRTEAKTRNFTCIYHPGLNAFLGGYGGKERGQTFCCLSSRSELWCVLHVCLHTMLFIIVEQHRGRGVPCDSITHGSLPNPIGCGLCTLMVSMARILTWCPAFQQSLKVNRALCTVVFQSPSVSFHDVRALCCGSPWSFCLSLTMIQCTSPSPLAFMNEERVETPSSLQALVEVKDRNLGVCACL